ncbi:MAG: RraA family protein [Desulfitobacterium hafniense]|nr:RraA family protein [Desulfitobacterium hafniense]
MQNERIERWRKFGTSNITDALDKLGLDGGCLDIKPIVQGARMVGTAYTVHYIPCGPVKGTVGDYIDDVNPGDVIVIDNGGRTFCTVWGDLLTLLATKKGIEGTVIDGVCRDVPTIRELKYPLFSKGHFMVTGKDRVEVDAVQIPVTVGGIKVCPGDILVGDENGVVVIPQDKADEVYKIAVEIDEAEEGIASLISEGYTIREARKRYGYHTLQRK